MFRLLSVRRCERGYSQHWAPGTRCQNYPSTKSMQHVRHYQYRPPIIFHFALQLVNWMLFRDCVLCFISRCYPSLWSWSLISSIPLILATINDAWPCPTSQTFSTQRLTTSLCFSPSFACWNSCLVVMVVTSVPTFVHVVFLGRSTEDTTSQVHAIQT